MGNWTFQFSQFGSEDPEEGHSLGCWGNKGWSPFLDPAPHFSPMSRGLRGWIPGHTEREAEGVPLCRCLGPTQAWASHCSLGVNY